MKPNDEQIEAAAKRMWDFYRTLGPLGALPMWETAPDRTKREFRALAAVALEGYVPSVVDVQVELAPLIVSFSGDRELDPCFVTVRIGTKEQMLSVAGWNRLKWRVDNLIGQNSEGSVTADR